MPKLRVADDNFWLSAFGVAPATEEATGDEVVQELRIPAKAGELLHITWDVTADSVRLRHWRGGRVVTDILREMATLLTVQGTGADSQVGVGYGSGGWTGRIQCRPHPEVVIVDNLLRT
jgi:hypothetical protein